jgi:hypothetical protein
MRVSSTKKRIVFIEGLFIKRKGYLKRPYLLQRPNRLPYWASSHEWRLASNGVKLLTAFIPQYFFMPIHAVGVFFGVGLDPFISGINRTYPFPIHATIAMTSV